MSCDMKWRVPQCGRPMANASLHRDIAAWLLCAGTALRYPWHSHHPALRHMAACAARESEVEVQYLHFVCYRGSQ